MTQLLYNIIRILAFAGIFSCSLKFYGKEFALKQGFLEKIINITSQNRIYMYNYNARSNIIV